MPSESSVSNTVFGKGFCKDDDLVVVRANDERIAKKEEAKVCV